MRKGKSRMRSSLIALAILLTSASLAAGSDIFTQDLLEKRYEGLTPAIGVIRYTAEVTNRNSGETSRAQRISLGLIVSSDGLVMANGHMELENRRPFNITITIGQGESEKEYDVEFLRKPKDLNVSFLQIQPDESHTFPFVAFDQEHSLQIGTPLSVFGILGAPLDYSRSLLEMRIGTILVKPRTTYCLSAGVGFGFVGGPVIDPSGRLVGVVGFDLSRGEGGDLYTRSGQPLLYQASLFQKYIDDPSAGQEEEPAYLGVYTQPLTDDFAEYWEIEKGGGLIVSTVVPTSPAEAAGFLPGDIITSFNGTPISAKQDRDVSAFSKLVRESGVDAEIPVEFIRDGESQSMHIQLAARPKERRDAEEYEDKLLGMTVQEITTDVRISRNLSPQVQGVIVKAVTSGGVSQIGRVRPGVIIMAIGEEPTRNIAEYKAASEALAAQKPSEVSLFATVGAATGFFRLEPRW